MIRIMKNNHTATVFLTGEIDHFSAEGIRRDVENAISDKCIQELIFNFDRVSFMDSSGVGMLIGRYKTMHQRGGCVKACGLSEQMAKLFRLAGLHRIIEMSSAEEEAVHA